MNKLFNCTAQAILTAVYSKKERAVSLILLSYVFILTIMFIYSISGTGYFPSSDDETIYYNAARLFAETNSLHASSIVSEDVSPVGSFNWYGPFYNIFYGTFAKVFGFGNFLFLYIHFLFALATIAVLLFFPAGFSDRLIIICCLLSTEAGTGFIFTYFPETFHVFSAAVMTFLLLRVDQHYATGNFSRYRNIYIGMVLFFMLSRVTSIFWLAGLLAYSRNRYSLLKNICLFIGGVLVTLAFQKFFTAPPFVQGLRALQYLYAGDWFIFIRKTAGMGLFNLSELFHSGSISVYLLVFLFFFVVWLYFSNGKRIHLAAILISFVVVCVLLALYTTYTIRFTKQTAMLVPLLLGTGLTTASPGRKVVFILFLISAPFAFSIAYHNIKERKTASDCFMENMGFIKELSGITGKMEQKNNTVLWAYNEYPFASNMIEAVIPLSTPGGFPVLYTTNIIPPDASPDLKFRKYGKLEIDYILSRFSLTDRHLQEVYKSEYFILYSTEKDKKQ